MVDSSFYAGVLRADRVSVFLNTEDMEDFIRTLSEEEVSQI